MKFSKWLLSFLAVYAELALGCQIYPLELVQRALLRGPLMTNITSSPNQWSGRTTIASGSATQTVSTFSINSDSILNLALEVALPAGYTTRGQISVVSGDISGVASTTAVFSGQAILTSFQSETAASSAGAVMGMLRVNSIVDGVSFAISTTNSAAFGHEAGLLNWAIPQAEPRGIKVNSISSGNYFTLGWADGQAKPRDVTVMWEVRRTS